MATSGSRADRRSPTSGAPWHWNTATRRVIGALDRLLEDDVGLVEAGRRPVAGVVADLDGRGPAGPAPTPPGAGVPVSGQVAAAAAAPWSSWSSRPPPSWPGVAAGRGPSGEDRRRRARRPRRRARTTRFVSVRRPLRPAAPCGTGWAAVRPSAAVRPGGVVPVVRHLGDAYVVRHRGDAAAPGVGATARSGIHHRTCVRVYSEPCRTAVNRRSSRTASQPVGIRGAGPAPGDGVTPPPYGRPGQVNDSTEEKQTRHGT